MTIKSLSLEKSGSKIFFLLELGLIIKSLSSIPLCLKYTQLSYMSVEKIIIFAVLVSRTIINSYPV